MPLKNSKANLEKLERLLNEGGYVLRMEKGNFNSGYCVLEHRKVVVINKFLDQEGRIAVLSDLLSDLNVDFNRLSGDSKKCYQMILTDAHKQDVLQKLVEQELEADAAEKEAVVPHDDQDNP